jgi:beta-glucosidase
VTENGVPVPNESEKPLQEALRDVFRLDYYRGYTEGVCQAVAEDGVNLTGYYAWSLMDNFEWLDGYRPRFGMTYVSHTQPLPPIANGAPCLCGAAVFCLCQPH